MPISFEDPATYAHWQENAGFSLTKDGLYTRVQTASGSGWVQSYRDPTARSGFRREPIASADARYGFVWRGIADARQLDSGISGGEMLVIDLKTQEILAIKRGFKYRWLGRYGSDQRLSATGFERGRSCAADIAQTPTRKFQDFTDFLIQVLRPATTQR